MRSWKLPLVAVLSSALVAVSVVPAAAASTPTVTQTVTGTVASVSVDGFGSPTTKDDRDDRVLVTPGGRVVPLAADERSAAAAVGDTVRATVSTGVQATARVVGSATPVVARTATTTAQSLYVVAIQDASTTGSFSTATAASIAGKAAAYWKGQVRGAISSFTVAGSKALAVADSCWTDYEDLWAQAAQIYPGVNFQQTGKHLVVFSPTGCYDEYGYAGVAGVGDRLSDGGYVQVVGQQWGILAHELGHNFGLGHTYLDLPSYDGNVYGYEYYGLYGPQALQADDYEPGVLDGAYRKQLDIPGEAAREQRVAWNARAATYTIAPLTASSGRTSLVIAGREAGADLYLDYRSGAGADANTFYAADSTGKITGFDEGDVTFRRGVHLTVADGQGNLDTVAVPVSSGEFRGAAHTGDVVRLWGGDLTLTFGAQTSAGTQVTVSFAGRPAVATRSRIAVPSVVEGSKGKVSVSVSAGATGAVSIYQDGKKIATRTLVRGATSLSTPRGLTRGKHTFTVRYAGDPASKASSASTTVVVKDRSKVRASAKKVTAGKRGTVWVHVYSDAKATGYVKVYRGSTYVAKAKVSHGKAVIRTPKSWKHKTYKLTVKYVGSSTVTASSTTVKLVVRKR